MLALLPKTPKTAHVHVTATVQLLQMLSELKADTSYFKLGERSASKDIG